jgi:peptidoglycan/xylan/chitin deacetylase (PgdA/CDA1 family)
VSYSPTRPHRLAAARAAALVMAAVAVVGTIGVAVQPAAAASPRTTISLTFDDGNANQLSAVSALNANGMKGTFYVVSGWVGAPGYLTRGDLDTLKSRGHEIGGHTVNHPDLPTLSSGEAARQICNDRQTLTSWGYTVRSFAYPFASSNRAVEKTVRDCGYRSGRLLGDLQTRFGCAGCAYAERTPPADPFATKALDQVDDTWTLADLQQSVVNAEKNGGGWVQFTFHDICDGCSDLAISPSVFGQFLSWLKPRAATNNTVVKTVGDVIGSTAKPVVAGPTVPPAGAGVNGVSNPSLETQGANGDPACWMRGGWGTNSPTFSLGGPAHTGSVSSGISMTGYSSGDAKLLPTFDLGQCSPTVVPGHTYSLRSWYTASGVTQFAVYLRNSVGQWVYWTSSPWFAAASDYTQAQWTTPQIPAGYSAMSFALTIFGNGSLRTDDVALYDSVGAPSAPAAATPTPASSAAPSAAPPSGQVEVSGPAESSTTP